MREKSSLSEYSLQYSTALLMSLSLRREGRNKFEQMPQNSVLMVLMEMINHHKNGNSTICIYLCETLFSILSRNKFKQQAITLKVKNSLAMIMSTTQNADLKVNIKQIIVQVDAVETPDNELDTSMMTTPEPVDDEEGQIAPEDDILDEYATKLAQQLKQKGFNLGNDWLLHLSKRDVTLFTISFINSKSEITRDFEGFDLNFDRMRWSNKVLGTRLEVRSLYHNEGDIQDSLEEESVENISNLIKCHTQKNDRQLQEAENDEEYTRNDCMKDKQRANSIHYENLCEGMNVKNVKDLVRQRGFQHFNQFASKQKSIENLEFLDNVTQKSKTLAEIYKFRDSQNVWQEFMLQKLWDAKLYSNSIKIFKHHNNSWQPFITNQEISSMVFNHPSNISTIFVGQFMYKFKIKKEHLIVNVSLECIDLETTHIGTLCTVHIVENSQFISLDAIKFILPVHFKASNEHMTWDKAKEFISGLDVAFVYRDSELNKESFCFEIRRAANLGETLYKHREYLPVIGGPNTWNQYNFPCFQVDDQIVMGVKRSIVIGKDNKKYIQIRKIPNEKRVELDDLRIKLESNLNMKYRILRDGHYVDKFDYNPFSSNEAIHVFNDFENNQLFFIEKQPGQHVLSKFEKTFEIEDPMEPDDLEDMNRVMVWESMTNGLMTYQKAINNIMYTYDPKSGVNVITYLSDFNASGINDIMQIPQRIKDTKLDGVQHFKTCVVPRQTKKEYIKNLRDKFKNESMVFLVCNSGLQNDLDMQSEDLNRRIFVNGQKECILVSGKKQVHMDDRYLMVQERFQQTQNDRSIRPMLLVETSGNYNYETPFQKIYFAFINLKKFEIVEKKEIKFKYPPKNLSYHTLQFYFQFVTSSQLKNQGKKLRERFSVACFSESAHEIMEFETITQLDPSGETIDLELYQVGKSFLESKCDDFDVVASALLPTLTHQNEIIGCQIVIGREQEDKKIYQIDSDLQSNFNHYLMHSCKTTHYSDTCQLIQVYQNQLRIENRKIFSDWDTQFQLDHIVNLEQQQVRFSMNSIIDSEEYDSAKPLQILQGQSIVNLSCKDKTQLQNVLPQIQGPLYTLDYNFQDALSHSLHDNQSFKMIMELVDPSLVQFSIGQILALGYEIDQDILCHLLTKMQDQDDLQKLSVSQDEKSKFINFMPMIHTKKVQNLIEDNSEKPQMNTLELLRVCDHLQSDKVCYQITDKIFENHSQKFQIAQAGLLVCLQLMPMILLDQRYTIIPFAIQFSIVGLIEIVKLFRNCGFIKSVWTMNNLVYLALSIMALILSEDNNDQDGSEEDNQPVQMALLFSSAIKLIGHLRSLDTFSKFWMTLLDIIPMAVILGAAVLIPYSSNQFENEFDLKSLVLGFWMILMFATLIQYGSDYTEEIRNFKSQMNFEYVLVFGSQKFEVLEIDHVNASEKVLDDGKHDQNKTAIIQTMFQLKNEVSVVKDQMVDLNEQLKRKQDDQIFENDYTNVLDLVPFSTQKKDPRSLRETAFFTSIQQTNSPVPRIQSPTFIQNNSELQIQLEDKNNEVDALRIQLKKMATDDDADSIQLNYRTIGNQTCEQLLSEKELDLMVETYELQRKIKMSDKQKNKLKKYEYFFYELKNRGIPVNDIYEEKGGVKEMPTERFEEMDQKDIMSQELDEEQVSFRSDDSFEDIFINPELESASRFKNLRNLWIPRLDLRIVEGYESTIDQHESAEEEQEEASQDYKSSLPPPIARSKKPKLSIVVDSYDELSMEFNETNLLDEVPIEHQEVELQSSNTKTPKNYSKNLLLNVSADEASMLPIISPLNYGQTQKGYSEFMFAIDNNLDLQTPKHMDEISLPDIQDDDKSTRKITPQKIKIQPPNPKLQQKPQKIQQPQQLQEEIKTKMDLEVKNKMEIFNSKIDSFCDDIDQKMDKKIEMVRFDIGNQIYDLSSQMDQMIELIKKKKGQTQNYNQEQNQEQTQEQISQE